MNKPRIGLNTAQLVNTIGLPSQTYKSDDLEVWQYDKCVSGICASRIYGIKNGVIVSDKRVRGL